MLIIKQHFVVQPNVFVWLWCRVSCGIATTIRRQKNVLNTLNQSQREAGKKQILHKLARVQDTEALRWKTDSLAGQQANIISAFFTPSSLHQFLALIACFCYTYEHISSFCNSFTAPRPGCGDTAVTQAHSQADTWHWATALTHGLMLAFLHPSHMIPPSLFTHLLPFQPFSFSASIFTKSQVFPCFLSSSYLHFLSRVRDDRFSRMFISVSSFFVHHPFLFSMVWLVLYFIVSSLILVSTLILIWFRLLCSVLLFPSLSSFLFFNYLSALLLSGFEIHK